MILESSYRMLEGPINHKEEQGFDVPETQKLYRVLRNFNVAYREKYPDHVHLHRYAYFIGVLALAVMDSERHYTPERIKMLIEAAKKEGIKIEGL